jgi:predicted ABC-type ATPase
MTGDPATPSWVGNFSAHPSAGGAPFDARFRDVHALCLVRAFQAANSTSPIACLLMGPPAAGKSRRLQRFFEEERGARNLLIINPDDYKPNIPGYPEVGADAVHEETSWIAHQARSVALGRKCSLLNDVVGADAEKYGNLIKRLRANGFTIELGCVYVEDLSLLLRRNQYRYETEGRLVPQEVIERAHAAIPSAFAELCTEVDAAFLFDGAQSGGTAWQMVSGEVRMRDPGFVHRLGVNLPP